MFRLRLPIVVDLLNRSFFSPLLVCAILVASLVCWYVAPAATVLRWMGEGNRIEVATVYLYGVAAVVALLCGRATRNQASGIALAVVMIAFAAREMDWHSRFTGTSMLRVSYYLGGAPLAHKIGALLALSIVGVAGVFLLRRHGRRVLRGFRDSDASAVTTVTILVSMVAAKVIDRSVGVLSESFGIQSSMAISALQVAIEEPLELGLPAMVVIGLLQNLLRRAPSVPETYHPHAGTKANQPRTR